MKTITLTTETLRSMLSAAFRCGEGEGIWLADLDIDLTDDMLCDKSEEYADHMMEFLEMVKSEG